MKYSNELKVGLAIAIAVVAFVLGVRYFKDVPLFTGQYDMYTEVADAKGLIPGNPVRINGVKVGSVRKVHFEQDRNLVRVDFQVNRDVVLPQGTTCTISGIDALTGVRIELELGDPGNPRINPGDVVPSADQDQDFASQLVERAPLLVDQVDSVLFGIEGTIGDVRGLIGDPDSDLRTSMAALRSSAVTLGDLLREEKSNISGILTNVNAVSSDLSAITSQQRDSIAMAISRLNGAMNSMESTMSSLESTTGQLDAILARIDDGSGTLGKLINDPALYNRLDSLVTGLDELLADFKKNPRRYLREMKIVDLF